MREKRTGFNRVTDGNNGGNVIIAECVVERLPSTEGVRSEDTKVRSMTEEEQEKYEMKVGMSLIVNREERRFLGRFE